MDAQRGEQADHPAGCALRNLRQGSVLARGEIGRGVKAPTDLLQQSLACELAEVPAGDPLGFEIAWADQPSPTDEVKSRRTVHQCHAPILMDMSEDVNKYIHIEQ